MPLIRVLSDMEILGIAIDRERLAAMRVDMEAAMRRLAAELYELAGGEFNLNSPKQLAEIMFTRLQLPVI